MNFSLNKENFTDSMQHNLSLAQLENTYLKLF